MNHTIGCHDIGFNHFRIFVQVDTSIFGADRDLCTVDCLCFIKLHDVGCLHRTWNDVVCQNRDKLVLVLWLEQAFNSSLRKLFESCVSWSKNSERSFALESLYQTCSFDSSNKCTEIFVRSSDIDDILLSALVSAKTDVNVTKHTATHDSKNANFFIMNSVGMGIQQERYRSM